MECAEAYCILKLFVHWRKRALGEGDDRGHGKNTKILSMKVSDLIFATQRHKNAFIKVIFVNAVDMLMLVKRHSRHT